MNEPLWRESVNPTIFLVVVVVVCAEKGEGGKALVGFGEVIGVFAGAVGLDALFCWLRRNSTCW
jgi:hypothetical protein